MLAAYNELLKQLQEKNASELKPEVTIEQKKEKEFQIKREVAEKQMAERDSRIKESEEELSSLRKKMEGFSKEFELAVQKTTKETTEKCQAESRNHEEFLKKSFEGERNVLQRIHHSGQATRPKNRYSVLQGKLTPMEKHSFSSC